MRQDEIEKIKQIKKIARNIDATNYNEVNTCLCEIMDLCDRLIQ